MSDIDTTDSDATPQEFVKGVEGEAIEGEWNTGLLPTMPQEPPTVPLTWYPSDVLLEGREEHSLDMPEGTQTGEGV